MSRSIDELDRAVAIIERALGISAEGPQPYDQRTIRAMVGWAAAEAGIEPSDILSGARLQEYVLPRNAIAYVAHDVLGYSFPRIGRALGRDHSSIIHGARNARKRRQRDADFRDLTDRMAKVFQKRKSA